MVVTRFALRPFFAGSLPGRRRMSPSAMPEYVRYDSRERMPSTMNTPTIHETCRPRADAGGIAEADFATGLAVVISGKANAGYSEPARFFALAELPERKAR